MWDEGKRAQVTIQIQSVGGASLDSLVPTIERAIASRYEGCANMSSDRMNVNGRDTLRIECAYDDDGKSFRGRMLFSKLDDDHLLTVIFRAFPDRFDKLVPQFEKMSRSIDLQADG